jgi:hypothetical protein
MIRDWILNQFRSLNVIASVIIPLLIVIIPSAITSHLLRRQGLVNNIRQRVLVLGEKAQIKKTTFSSRLIELHSVARSSLHEKVEECLKHCDSIIDQTENMLKELNTSPKGSKLKSIENQLIIVEDMNSKIPFKM